MSVLITEINNGMSIKFEERCEAFCATQDCSVRHLVLPGSRTLGEAKQGLILTKTLKHQQQFEKRCKALVNYLKFP